MTTQRAYTPVEGPAAWTRQCIEQDTTWSYTLSAAERGEVLDAVQAVKRNAVPLDKVDESTFPLPGLGPRLNGFLHDVETQRGFVLIRDVPLDDLDGRDIERLYWGIMRRFGTPITQNSKGEFIGHVRDLGLRWGEIRDGERVRGYLTSALLHFHSDNTDLVGLLCLQPAKSGGISSIVSAVSIYNEVLRHHAEHLPQLTEGFHYSLRGEQSPGALPYTESRVPVFSLFDDQLSCGYVRKAIEQGAEDRAVPLSSRERAALDVIDTLANRDDLRVDMTLARGDLQILNNYTIFHSRSEFVDHDEPQRRRHLLRMWLRSKTSRKLAPDFANRYGRAAPYRSLAST